ncbi:MAG TPA: hypothetical protein VHD90_22135 [Phototrophicaceae bacterium]|nr:hypothetical protein [Phototrophicaceae bacterium]
MSQQTEQRIEVREAIAKAREYIKQLYADDRLERLMLEGVELSDDEQRWVITFGFDVPPVRQLYNDMGFSTPLAKDYERTYRDILVNAITGEVISMKPRLIWKTS